MTYHVTFRPETEQDFRRLDSQIDERILRKIKWLSENFELVTHSLSRENGRGSLNCGLVTIELFTL